jgi:hypothetical protein
MERLLKCNSCKHDISLNEDEWNRHRNFWRSNTNILKRSFICDSCLCKIKSQGIDNEKDQTPAENATVISTKEFSNKIDAIWKIYLDRYRSETFCANDVESFKTSLNDLLKEEGVMEGCILDFEIEDKKLENGSTLYFPVKFEKIHIKIPFVKNLVEIPVSSENLYFQ